MSTEHLNENGELCQGYYCCTCGRSCSMYGHRDTCTPNPQLVKRISAINEAGSLEAYTFNLLKEKG